MIHIHNFGWRLGNQLFQIATAIAVAKNNDDEVDFPAWNYAEHFEGDFAPKNSGSPKFMWDEPHFHYASINYTANMGINGYFQSEKYFEGAEDEIKAALSPKQEIKDKILEKYGDLLSQDNICALHVRRGDYVGLQDHHPVQNLNYYMKAVKKFPKNYQFLVFSDDTKWCKENFPEGKFIVIEGGTDVEDFTMMTMCKNNVIGNSSFSWWSAWLNDNPEKKVVAPSKWFGPALSKHDTKDLYCNGWEIV